MKISKKRISKGGAVDLINNNGGKICTVTYKTKAGKETVLNGTRAAVQLHNNLGYITMYDMKNKGFKQVTTANILSIKTNGTTYKVNQ